MFSDSEFNINTNRNVGLSQPSSSSPPSSPSSFKGLRRLCPRCSQIKDLEHFLFKPRRPLRDIENTFNNRVTSTKYNSQCKECFKKRKVKQIEATHNKRRKSDDAKLRLFQSYSWEDIVRMIDEGFSSRSRRY